MKTSMVNDCLKIARARASEGWFVDRANPGDIVLAAESGRRSSVDMSVWLIMYGAESQLVEPHPRAPYRTEPAPEPLSISFRTATNGTYPEIDSLEILHRILSGMNDKDRAASFAYLSARLGHG